MLLKYKLNNAFNPKRIRKAYQGDTLLPAKASVNP